eukprot:snap_masked-scaffold_6-processed-gene-13.30-mRNA-1 protein AED:1.00 eAED:1.00 QI:0/-1/0/0/-1/1/1/0/336
MFDRVSVTECELPLLPSRNSSECDSSVFEEFEVFSRIWQAYSVISHGLILIAAMYILCCYLKDNKEKVKMATNSYSRKSAQKEFSLFFANAMFFLYTIVGLLTKIAHEANGFSLLFEFTSAQGKIQAGLQTTSIFCLFMSQLSFLPVMNSLLGSDFFNKENEKIFTRLLKFTKNYCHVVHISTLILIVFEKLTYPSFLTVYFISFVFPSLTQVILVVFILNKVIENLRELNRLYKKMGKKDKRARVYVLTKKLYSYKRIVVFQKLTYFFIIGPLSFSPLNKILQVLLAHTVSGTIVWLSNLSVVALYSKYIIPDSDQCISYKQELEAFRFPKKPTI